MMYFHIPPALLLLWQCSTSVAFHLPLQKIQTVRQSTLLRWSESDDEGSSRSRKTIDPFVLETSQERTKRLEMVQSIKRSFYGDSKVRTTTISNPKCNSVLDNVPICHAEWAELPGYQNVLNVADTTHIYQSILSGPKPWYFGHVYTQERTEELSGQTISKTGVLMKISDYSQEQDGSLSLVVQSLERFEVMEYKDRRRQYAKVKLHPDSELALHHYSAAQKMVQDLSPDFLDDRDAWGAACAAALETADRLREYEYCPLATNNEDVSTLANFNINVDIETIFPMDYSLAKEQKNKVDEVMENHLFSANPVDIPKDLEDLDTEEVIQMERDVWLSLDKLVKLLHQLTGNSNEIRSTPIPVQMLGLLPRGSCRSGYLRWPGDFELDRFANRLEEYAVGCTSGAFVRYDYADNALSAYPVLRRAQRLSFAVWDLLEEIGCLVEEETITRQEVLEISSITQRLEVAKERIDDINRELCSMLLGI